MGSHTFFGQFMTNVMMRLLLRISGGDTFYTFNRRFFHVARFPSDSKQVLDFNTALVLQGPISTRNNFTFKTIKHYLDTYENLEIILSTWDDEDTSLFGEFFSSGRFHLVKSVYPDFRGISNINLQIVSSRAGLDVAKTLRVERVIKSRTDQAVLDNSAITIIERYFELFTSPSYLPILTLDRNSFLYRLYGVSDMFQYSDLETLTIFWAVDLDTRDIKDVFEPKPTNILEYAIRNTGETYLVTSYLSRRGELIDFTFENYLEYLKKYFLVVDSFQLGYVWNKYTSEERPWKDPTKLPEFREIQFIDWLTLNSNKVQLTTDFKNLNSRDGVY